MSRYCLLTRGGEPMVWDLDQRRAITNFSRRGWNRTTVGRECWVCAERSLFGRSLRVRRQGDRRRPERSGPSRSTGGNRYRRTSVPVRNAKRRSRDTRRSELMLDARQIKNQDELMLLSRRRNGRRCLQDIFEALKPGIRENEIVALANSDSMRWVPTRSSHQRRLGRAV